MPIFLAIPFIGKIAVSVGTLLWTGAAAAGGTAAVAGYNNSKANSKVREANRLKEEADAEMEKLLESLNRQYRKFFDEALTQYKSMYEKLRAKMSLASESVPPSIKRPSEFRFSDRLSKTDLKRTSLDDIDWNKVNRTSADAMRAGYLASRPQAAIGSAAPAATGLAMGGAAAALSVMGSFISASEKRVTEAVRSLSEAETYVAHVKAMKKVHRQSVREDIAARKEVMASLLAILDEELAKTTPFDQLALILANAGEILSRRCFPRAKGGSS